MGRRNLPRVLQVVSSVGISHGGTATAVVGLSHALQEFGTEVVVFSTNAATPGRSRDRRVGLGPSDLPRNAKHLNVRFFPVKAPYRWLFAPEMGLALRKEIGRFDLVHIHGIYSYPQYAACRAAYRAGVPYVVSTHGNLNPYIRMRGRLQKFIASAMWIQRMLNNAAAIHCTTVAERDHIANIAKRTRRIVIPNGMYIDDFKELPDGREFRFRFLGGSAAPLILSHGRLSPTKGLDVLINALHLVRRQYPTAVLAVVGADNDNLKHQLLAQASRLGVANAVYFPGELVGEELLSAFSAADVWASPSHSENFGLAAAEAMAAGVPVIASSAINMAPDACSEGALRMVNNDAEAFGAAIADLLGDREGRESLAERGQKYVQRFDWRQIGCEYLDLYSELVQSGNGRSAR